MTEQTNERLTTHPFGLPNQPIDRLIDRQVVQTLPGGETVVLSNATMFSYPIKFNGGALECPPQVLDQLSQPSDSFPF